MKLNSRQGILMAVSSIVLLSLGLFPRWQQVAMREPFKKDIGRAFLFRPPAPVAVDCYFAGCKSAPAAYFHVVLYREVLVAQLLSVLGVTVVALWIFRTRRDGTEANLRSNKTKLSLSLLVALLFPPLGTFPLGVLLLDIPRQVSHKNELWLLPALMVIATYVACALFAFGLLTSAIWVYNRLGTRGTEQGS